jgi:hypothetical protein
LLAHDLIVDGNDGDEIRRCLGAADLRAKVGEGGLDAINEADVSRTVPERERCSPEAGHNDRHRGP